MSVTNMNHALPIGAHADLGGVRSLFARARDAFAAWRSARATASALAELSDKQLADIGLARGDIVEVAEALAGR